MIKESIIASKLMYIVLRNFSTKANTEGNPFSNHNTLEMDRNGVTL